jgi:uncharacterized protein (TIGR01777 family)
VKVVIAGASGFLGQALLRDLITRGHDVTTLVRRKPLSVREIEWHPERNELDPAVLADMQAVVTLAGAGISDKRWSAGYKHTLLKSRLQPTTTIARALASLPDDSRPATFISASAIGYYGDRGDELLDETSAAGTGFLADLCSGWEAATAPAEATGVRVARLRTGLVLAASGGLLKRLLPIFKAGFGGKLGSGDQYQSWISLSDTIGAVCHVLTTDQITGPVNLTAPDPVQNREFSATLASVLHRPSFVSVPGFALRLALGEFADQGVLTSQRAIPAALAASGYRFEHTDLRFALNWAVHN